MDVDVVLDQAMVMSKVYYGNDLSYANFRKVQLVQNSTTKLIAKANRRCHITHILKYWH